jgi:hypothetical protein
VRARDAVPQITLYLDREAIRVMRDHAAAAGVPYSRWVAALIRRQSKAYWRPEITSIFGAHVDMPNPGLPVFGVKSYDRSSQQEAGAGDAIGEPGFAEATGARGNPHNAGDPGGPSYAGISGGGGISVERGFWGEPDIAGEPGVTGEPGLASDPGLADGSSSLRGRG